MKRHSCMELMACSWSLRGPGAQRILIPCMRPEPPTQASATFRQACANAPRGSPPLRCRSLEVRLAEAIGIGLLRAGGRSWRPASRHRSAQLRTQIRHTNGQECAHPNTCIHLRARERGGVHGVLRPAKRPRRFAPRCVHKCARMRARAAAFAFAHGWPSGPSLFEVAERPWLLTPQD